MPGGTAFSLLGLFSALTVFSVMLTLGMRLTPANFATIWRAPGLMLRGLACVFLVVPTAAYAVCVALGITGPERAGLLLMAISPGAPVALRRSLRAGGGVELAPSLHLVVVLLAIPFVPLAVFVFDMILGAKAEADAFAIARQVFVAQVIPLAAGVVFARVAPTLAARVARATAAGTAALLVVLMVVVLAFTWRIVAEAGATVLVGAGLTTAIALLAGDRLGAPDRQSSIAMAVAGALRNPGLAILVASLNRAPKLVLASVLGYALVTAALVTAYVMLRRPR